MKDRNQLYRERNAAGLCRSCCKPLAATSKVFCPDHLEGHRKTCKGNRFSVRRAKAKARGIGWLMSDEDFTKWLQATPRACYYCGVSEETLKLSKRKKSYMTVDRRDNSKGYSLDNICLACQRCNYFKSNFFREGEWLEIAERFIKPRLLEYHAVDQ